MAARSRARALAALVLAALLSGGASLPAEPPRIDAADLALSPPAGSISVLAYNVKGLPWPLASGRSKALAAISVRLRTLRDRGQQPTVLVLEEAFTGEAKQIGRDAGYAYAAFGPSKLETGLAGKTPAARSFLGAGNPLIGEGLGKAADSGLVIFSDFPIVGTSRMAFPDEACAGFDCLANKGVVAAMIAVPGFRHPLAVIATHLNARGASSAPIPRTLAAYRKQLDLLGGFVAAMRRTGSPIVLGGDLNVGKSPERRAAMRAFLQTAGVTDPAAGSVLDECLSRSSACRIGRVADARDALRHNKDWQLRWPSAHTALTPVAVSVPFGRERNRTMLSDHVGYVVHYAPAAPR